MNVLLLQGGHAQRLAATQPSAEAKVRWPTHFPKLNKPRPITGAPPVSPQAPRRLVSAVQRELGQRGYYSARPSGTLTILTRAAIMAYEADHGMSLTGEASDQFLHAVLLGATIKMTRAKEKIGPEAKAIIEQVQSLLINAGYLDVTPTGTFDAVTRHGILAFERNNNLSPKGRVSAAVLKQLLANARKNS